MIRTLGTSLCRRKYSPRFSLRKLNGHSAAHYRRRPSVAARSRSLSILDKFHRLDHLHVSESVSSLLNQSGYSFVANRHNSSSTSHLNSQYQKFDTIDKSELKRLYHIRNVGVFAHVDAGKTTVTERMLALAGIVHRAGSVDSGNTVTDFLPAERERGITIQSAAISFGWKWHNNAVDSNSNSDGLGDDDNDEVTIQLIDTPGHVDFSVEVNRSVAVLDGAVLVVDAVAGVQAQTETVWRAMTQPSINNHDTGVGGHGKGVAVASISTSHEPLPCVAMINKMDKEGCNFGHAMNTLKYKLPGANPVAIQIPLFQVGSSSGTTSNAATNDNDNDNPSPSVGNARDLPGNILAVPPNDLNMTSLTNGHFVGVVDLIEMRAIVWPETGPGGVSDVERCIPSIYNLSLDGNDNDDEEVESQVSATARSSRQDLVASLADFDETMEEYFLMEEDPSNQDLRLALRNATLERNVLPVMAGAALKGKGVEPLLDSIADLLPSPLHRKHPAMMSYDDTSYASNRGKKKSGRKEKNQLQSEKDAVGKIPFGNPLHPSFLALAFKVVHMKNRGGSGDGRVVFARVYSGKISSGDTVKIISPRVPGEKPDEPRNERVGGMLELAGGRFDNLQDAMCSSGEVCALVGLKSVVTGDTLLLASDSNGGKGKKGKKGNDKNDSAGSDFEVTPSNVYLAGVASPKPVLTVRVEAESAEQQAKLLEALNLLAIEDPSLRVEETSSATLLSGLGELHIEVVVDRLKREYGLPVWIGKPSVTYRETVQEIIETDGMVNYDRTVGATRMQASVHLQLEPLHNQNDSAGEECVLPTDPVVTLGPKAREYLGFDLDSTEDEISQRSEIAHALISGCKGAMKRGSWGAYELANTRCHIIEIDAEGGIAALKAMPGAIRAASSTILTSTLMEHKEQCSVLEPVMSVEVSAPSDIVGTVLSDMTTRRGVIGEVIMGDEDTHGKALIHGQVPLAEILGYANTLRSITGGEGTFSAEYKGHSACDK